MKSEIKQRPKGSCELPQRLWRVLPQGVRAVLCSVLFQGVFDDVEEIRLRSGRALAVKISGKNRIFDSCVVAEDELKDCLDAICGSSLYAHIESINQGYITIEGGIRIGIVGQVRCERGNVVGLCDVKSLCIRIPHVFRVNSSKICDLVREGKSILIYSKAGVGKTTLLRAVASELSDASFHESMNVALVDTREELAWGINGEKNTVDVLSGYPKGKGIEIATRVMSPNVIVCDEIGVQEVGELLFSTNCGVSVIASAHAGNVFELLHREGIKKLHVGHVFSCYVGITRSTCGGFDYEVISWEEADAIFKDDR